MAIPVERYKKRKEKYENANKKLHKVSFNISVLRLIIFIAVISASIFFYKANLIYFVISSLTCGVVLFIYLIYLHQKVLHKIKYLDVLISVNQKSIERITGKWKSFDDLGEEFIDESHNYSYDIDIFGENSLFQFINTCVTYSGRKTLAEFLTKRSKTKEEIYERQEAIQELSKKVSFRQKLIACGILNNKVSSNPQKLYEYERDSHKQMLNKSTIVFVTIMPIITLAMCIIYFFIKSIPYYVPMLLLLLQYAILKIKPQNRLIAFELAEKYNKDIKMYKDMLQLIENQIFYSPYLKRIKNEFYCDDNVASHMAIRKFSNIADLIANRRDIVYSILNIVLLMDFHLFRALQKWNNKYGKNIKKWIESIGKIEALSSFSNLKYDYPNWVNPKIEENKFHLEAIDIGHPLLGENCIHNDIIIKEPNRVLLITGSNMSGKSTLLRTIGINLVLSYAGAPVCARKFNVPIMDLYTCMRINDNMEKNISSFYGEILRIKRIVEAVNDNKNVFFLLDEIFKGTNSVDRHTGAAILIKQLAKKGSMGLVSTHDLELSELEKENDSMVLNYHFEEYYKDDKIYFDYKLKRGVSTTRNAIYLMKLAGIKI